MKNPVNISNVRKPLRGILFILLLLIVSNTFISSISQFVIVNREINKAGSHYKSIGTIQPLDIEGVYVNEARDLIYTDSMIAYEDNQRVCQGIIEGLYNTENIHQYERLDNETHDAENDYKTFLGDIVFIAKVIQVAKAPSAESIYDGLTIVVDIEEILGGYPDYLKEGFRSEIGVAAKSLKTGEKINYISDKVIEELLSLETGKTYLFRTYWDASLKGFTMIKPLYKNGSLYEKLSDSGYIDFNNSKLSILKEDIDVLNENIQSYAINTTRDMTSIPVFQEIMKYYYLKEGRFLTEEDNINQNYVCVINEELAEMKNISIGDKLDIKMRNTEKGWSYLATSKDRKEWKNYKISCEASFEVIGIFASANKNLASRGRIIYIPDSTLPVEYGYYYNQGLDEADIDSYLYNFVLKSSEYQSEFIKKYEESLKEMGYSLYFIENNAEGFWNSARPIKNSSLISFILFTVLLLLTHSFLIYIYVDGHKLNYSIERALGIPKRTSERHLILPLILYGGVASVIGGFLGYKKAIDKSKELLTNISEVMQAHISLKFDIKIFFLFITLLILIFIAILMLQVNRLKRQSIIELINTNGIRKKNKKNIRSVKEEDNKESNFKFLSETEYKDENLLVHGSRHTLRRFSIIHSLRSKRLSMLLIMLAGMFVFVLLWMNYLMIRNKDFIDTAYNETIVTGDIVTNYNTTVAGTMRGPISGTHIENILKTDLVEDYISIADMGYSHMYIEKNGEETKYEIPEEEKRQYHTSKTTFNIMASNKYYTDEGKLKLTDLNLLEGYTLDDFYKDYRIDFSNRSNPTIRDEKGKVEVPILASEKSMEDYELKIGDKIALVEDSRDTIKIYGTIIGTFGELNMIQLHEYLEYYTTTVVNEQSIFIYPKAVLQAIERNREYYRSISFEFKAEKNRELLAQKDELKNMVINNIYDDYKNELKIWDEELINVVKPLEKSITLLEVLYPITLIFSIVIAGILGFMMVLRRSTDVAILRILGVKEKEVQWNLFRENILLVSIGIVVSLIIILSITVNSYSIDSAKYAMVYGGYLLGTIVGLILGIGKVTNKKPLEMLQVKE